MTLVPLLTKFVTADAFDLFLACDMPKLDPLGITKAIPIKIKGIGRKRDQRVRFSNRNKDNIAIDPVRATTIPNVIIEILSYYHANRYAKKNPMALPIEGIELKRPY